MRRTDRKSTRLNSSHTVIYTLSLHDALPICVATSGFNWLSSFSTCTGTPPSLPPFCSTTIMNASYRSEEHTSELQSHSDLHSFPTRRSSDLRRDLGLQLAVFLQHLHRHAAQFAAVLLDDHHECVV